MRTVEPVCRLLESIGASYALIGGRGVEARGFPRMTLDYDFHHRPARPSTRDLEKRQHAAALQG